MLNHLKKSCPSRGLMTSRKFTGKRFSLTKIFQFPDLSVFHVLVSHHWRIRLTSEFDLKKKSDFTAICNIEVGVEMLIAAFILLVW